MSNISYSLFYCSSTAYDTYGNGGVYVGYEFSKFMINYRLSFFKFIYFVNVADIDRRTTW